eukprot:403375845
MSQDSTKTFQEYRDQSYGYSSNDEKSNNRRNNRRSNSKDDSQNQNLRQSIDSKQNSTRSSEEQQPDYNSLDLIQKLKYIYQKLREDPSLKTSQQHKTLQLLLDYLKQNRNQLDFDNELFEYFKDVLFSLFKQKRLIFLKEYKSFDIVIDLIKTLKDYKYESDLREVYDSQDVLRRIEKTREKYLKEQIEYKKRKRNQKAMDKQRELLRERDEQARLKRQKEREEGELEDDKPRSTNLDYNKYSKASSSVHESLRNDNGSISDYKQLRDGSQTIYQENRAGGQNYYQSECDRSICNSNFELNINNSTYSSLMGRSTNDNKMQRDLQSEQLKSLNLNSDFKRLSEDFLQTEEDVQELMRKKTIIQSFMTKSMLAKLNDFRK